MKNGIGMKTIMKKTISIFLTILLMISGCVNQEKKFSINTEMIKTLPDDYSISKEDGEIYGSWWAYSLTVDSNQTYYLSFYDSVGNPGIEGKVIHLDKDTIIVEVNHEYYDQMLGNTWTLDHDEQYLTMTYKVDEKGITFTNNNESIRFAQYELEEDVTPYIFIESKYIEKIKGDYTVTINNTEYNCTIYEYYKIDEDEYDGFITIGDEGEYIMMAAIWQLCEKNEMMINPLVWSEELEQYIDFSKDYITIHYNKKGDVLSLIGEDSLQFIKK